MWTLSSSTLRSFHSIWFVCCSSSSWSLIHCASSLCLTSYSSMICQNFFTSPMSDGFSVWIVFFLVPCRMSWHLSWTSYSVCSLLVYLQSLCALACSVSFRSSLQAMSSSSAVILCFLRMVFSLLLILLVVFPLVYSVMMDMFPHSWSIFFWGLCCQAGGPPLGFLLIGV